jgi:hypothetical protein
VLEGPVPEGTLAEGPLVEWLLAEWPLAEGPLVAGTLAARAASPSSSTCFSYCFFAAPNAILEKWKTSCQVGSFKFVRETNEENEITDKSYCSAIKEGSVK